MIIGWTTNTSEKFLEEKRKKKENEAIKFIKKIKFRNNFLLSSYS